MYYTQIRNFFLDFLKLFISKKMLINKFNEIISNFYSPRGP